MIIKKGSATPWGAADHVTTIERQSGVIFKVSTPGHGGYYVPDALLTRIPMAGRRYAQQWSGSPNWFEEDCAWAYVAINLPEFFDERAIQAARDTLVFIERESKAVRSC